MRPPQGQRTQRRNCGQQELPRFRNCVGVGTLDVVHGASATLKCPAGFPLARLLPGHNPELFCERSSLAFTDLAEYRCTPAQAPR